MEGHLLNLIAKTLVEYIKPLEDANQGETKFSDPSSQTPEIELLDQALEALCKNIKDSTQKLQPVGVSQSTEANVSSSQASQTVQYPIVSLGEHKNEVVDLVLKRIKVSYDILDLHSRLCLLSLSIFPENVVIKKRHTIYWWIGDGFVKNTKEKMAEEKGEEIFDELLNSYLIVPHDNGKCPIVNKFKINPWIRHMLVSLVPREINNQLFYSQIGSSHQYLPSHTCLVLDQQKVKISDEFGLEYDNWRTVFNVGASYLNFGPQWMTKMKKLVVLQLGRWQASPSHHIEVENVEFLKGLKDQKNLKYLSLRGISRISELPPSIGQLVGLEILDLKACHNLETLPNEIALLRTLTHLDVSQCYLLESMPKGIEKLNELQVLKGFVIGSSTKTPCRISDLAKLKNLKRLSIHIGSEAVIQEGDFESLKDFITVKRLKISWGVNKDIHISLPSGLEKLDLEGYPSETIPEWLKPSKLPSGLKKLYIKGGKLNVTDHGEKGRASGVKIVRIKYQNHLHMTSPNLKELFPSLEYAEWNHFQWTFEEKGKTTTSKS
ncbi:disease resistance RPP13-like protein 4 [Abrus precatorius]|uniref:Disease resistance RPP13-like protein 4 n=1 Tax=Abrus precatorius TaxID=3816 RepID=A0A8B8KB41_ABRPR|nr:disease resistance RPP13-like protein 4 [Abrus precatorius]